MILRFYKDHDFSFKNLSEACCFSVWFKKTGFPVTLLMPSLHVIDIFSFEFRYYISSLSGDAWKIGRAIRSHWSVENKLHWQLDVSYGEDDCKVRKDNGPENFSVIRRATLNLLKSDKQTKAGIKNKRSKAGWDKEYMLRILRMEC
jgi:hypothetical protein